jgi:hypothetical protein
MQITGSVDESVIAATLRELADLCGITKELIFRCAKHTFAIR